MSEESSSTTDRDLTTTRKQVFGTVERGAECRICGRAVSDGRSVHCSDYCRDLADAVMSLLNWSSVRRRIIDRDDGTCQECGFKESWISKGNDHIRAIIDSKLPERPESPALDEIPERKEYDWSAHWERVDEWRQRREELKERYGDPWTREKRLEVDHITPISEGGHPFDPANLQTLCSDCHKEKTAREASERAERRKAERPERSLEEYLQP